MPGAGREEPQAGWASWGAHLGWGVCTVTPASHTVPPRAPREASGQLALRPHRLQMRKPRLGRTAGPGQPAGGGGAARPRSALHGACEATTLRSAGARAGCPGHEPRCPGSPLPGLPVPEPCLALTQGHGSTNPEAARSPQRPQRGWLCPRSPPRPTRVTHHACSLTASWAPWEAVLLGPQAQGERGSERPPSAECRAG